MSQPTSSSPPAGPVVVWTSPGMPLAKAVSAAVAELQEGDPLAMVRILASDGATNDSLRRALPFAGGVCGAEISGTLRLARELAEPALGDRRVAPPVAVLAAVQQVLHEPTTRPAAFQSCWTYPATHDALVRSYASLNGVFTLEPARAVSVLDELAGGRRSARAVTSVVAAVRRTLLANGLLDDAELLRLAAAAAWQAPHQPPLVVVITQQFNPAHVELVRGLIASARRCVVVAARSTPALSVAGHVSRLLGHPVEEPGDPAAPCVVPTVLSCPDHDEEVRVVVRRIVGLLNQGVTADQITVFYPPGGPHRAAIGAMLAAAGVPVRGQVRPVLRGSVAGQIVRVLLSALAGLDRRSVIELSRLAPLGWRPEAEDPGGEAGAGGGAGSARRRHADAWLRRCRTLGVVFDTDWERARLADPQETDHQIRAKHLTPALSGFVDRQQHLRRSVLAATTWPDIAAALEAWWRDHCGTEAWRLANWRGYPAWQLEAAQQVESVLTDLAQVGQFGLRPDRREAQRLLEAALDDDVITTESKGTGVAVSQIVEGAGSITRHAFIVGANDGLMPGRRGDDLVITATHGVEPFGVLTSPANRPLRDQRGFVGAVAGAAESVTITFARHDLRNGGGLFPSPLIHGSPPQVITSHSHQLMHGDDAWLDPAEWYAADPSRLHPRLSRRRRAITSRLQDHPTEYDGQVGELAQYGAVNPLTAMAADGTRRSVGITSLEALVSCGMHYFVRHVLGADVHDTDATELTDIEARERGTLLHEVFDRLTREWLEAHPHHHGPWIADQHELAERISRADELFEEISHHLIQRNRVGHPQVWAGRSKQIRAAIHHALRREMEDQTRPVASELRFGSRRPDAAPPVAWEHPLVPGGVSFNGSVDRVNRLSSGALQVVDLKSSRGSDYRSVTAEAPLGKDGNRLQPAFYAMAVQHVLGEPVAASGYRFVGRPTADPDVMLPVTAEVRDALDQRFVELAAQISSGMFHPGALEQSLFGASCHTCSPDDLGIDDIAQRVGRWARALQDSHADTGGDGAAAGPRPHRAHGGVPR